MSLPLSSSEAMSLPFVAITEDAGVGEILTIGGATVLLADDVINLTAEERVGFANPAIFTPVIGASRHLPTQFCRNVALAHAAPRARARALAMRSRCSS